MEKFALSKKYHGLEKNVWVEFVKLALEYKPLNLGQGLPDDLVPEYVLQSLAGKYTDDFVFPGLKRHN
jgi:kynurenine--oxoglutarate transaminase/cysteine-S-conjugate beta-lyase/glutamine--phenylpyruvate transaminase